MPPKKSNRTLEPLAQIDCSSIFSNSTSCTDLSSPAVSSRVLYHESFGRPATSKSLPPRREDSRDPRKQYQSHHHTNSAETYTTRTAPSPSTKQKDRSDSCLHFGKNINTSNNMKKHNNYDKMTGELPGTITTEEEFDALPIAVRRKFFSTLERLRFAQSASIQSEESEAPFQNDLPSTHSSSLAERRGLNKRVSINTGRRSQSTSRINHSKSRRNRKSAIFPSDQLSSLTPDAPHSPRTFFMTLPEKIQQSQFSREEQIALAGGLREGRGGRGRESVILDAADEAIYKASCHRTKKKEPEKLLRASPLPESLRSSMDSLRLDKNAVIEEEHDFKKESDILQAYDSFRWLDEESELDLRLDNHLDDYHANLSGTFLHSPDESTRRPTFRRRISISKIPFGNARNSLSSPTNSAQPKDIWAAPPTKGHEPKRSRALSLIPSSKHSSTPSSDLGGHAFADPNASHWQDPDARLKLRVYLASPQKFDEAIEFGFPSLERESISTPRSDKENRPPFDRNESTESSRFRHGGGGSNGTGTTFLNDDDELVFDDMSMIDPDSPKTPLEMGDLYNLARHRSLTSQSNLNSHMRYTSKGSSNSSSARVSRERNGDERDYSHLGITRPVLHKRAETDGFLGMSSASEGRGSLNYMHQPLGPGNREMTLRMTLTRPDLRTDVPPAVPDKDSKAGKVLGPGLVDRGPIPLGFGMGTGQLGWQHAGTQTTITAGKVDDDRDAWEEKYGNGVRGPLGGHDGWDVEKGEGGVVKRFWKKVKSSQKRS